MEITSLCLSRGWDVTLLNRGKMNAAPDTRIRRIQADISDEASVAALLQGAFYDVVVNFIVYKPEEALRDIRLFAGKTHQYIFISSASCYQKPPAHYIITESTPLSNPFWAYSRDKIACEEIFGQAYRTSGFPVTIVRPSHTYGITKIPVGLYGKSAWQVVKRVREGKPILVQGDGSSLWTLTHSRDFAKGFAGLMGNPHALGEAVHITSDESLTWNQIYAAIGRVLGIEPKLFHVSADFVSQCDPTLGGALLGDKCVSVVFDNSKIKRLVPGFRADIRYDQGVRWSIEHFLANPALQIEDAAFDRFTDRVISALHQAAKVVQGME
jgi:nucleoside-diphosphate-sugar epimerase